MSEQPSSPQPDHEPPAIELTPARKEVIQAVRNIDTVDVWREGQHEKLNELRSDINNTQYVDEFNNGIDESLKEFLAQQGLDPSYKEYQELFDMYRNASIDRIHKDEWLTSPASRGGDVSDTKSERDRVMDHIQSVIEADRQVEAGLEAFNTARAAKHQAYVDKMRGPVFLYPGRRKELQKAYDEAHQKYIAVLGETMQKEMEEWTQAGKASHEIEKLIEEHTNKRFQQDVEQQRQLLVDESGWIGRRLAEYANIDKPWKKFLVTAGLGVAGLGLGLTVGLVAGAAGTVIGAATAAAVGAGGMKAFGVARMYKLRQADLFKKQTDLAKFEVSQLGDGVNTPTAKGVRQLALDFLRDQSNEQLERGENIKKRAVYWSLGTVAVGGVTGTLLHGVWVGEGVGAHWRGGQIEHWLDGSHTSSPTGPDLDNPNLGGNGGKVEVPAPQEPLPPTEPEPGMSRGEIIQQYVGENAAARKISNGEGLFQTLKELGVPAEHRREFMEKYGEQLIKKFPKAFYRMPNGETGILMTENGKMPRKALEYMVSKAEKRDWIELPELASVTQEQVSTSVSMPTETAVEQLIASPDASSEFVAASTVSKGESLTRMLDELKTVGVIDTSAEKYNGLIKEVGPQLAKFKYSDGTPVAYLNRFRPYDWRLNLPPDGERLHAEAIRKIERLARRSTYALGA